MNKNSLKIQRMAGMAILIALCVAVSFFGNYFNFGVLNINLSLIVIIIGACLYGPLFGLGLGVISGLITVIAPSTAWFLGYTVIGTIAVCTLKTGIAGLVSGLLFKALYKSNFVIATFAAAMCVPIINTGLFAVGCYTIFNGLIADYAAQSAVSMSYVIFIVFIGANFLFELPAVTLLTPAVEQLIKILTKNKRLGFSYEIEEDAQ